MNKKTGKMCEVCKGRLGRVTSVSKKVTVTLLEKNRFRFKHYHWSCFKHTTPKEVLK